MATRKQLEFAKGIYLAAKKGEIDPVFVTAQACLETGWGKSKIGKFNIFGITKGSWTGKTVLILTTEYFSTPNKVFKAPERKVSVVKIGPTKYKYTVKRLFREYDSLKHALDDHTAIFKKDMYADAWPFRKDPVKFAEKICDNMGAKYATSPSYLTSLKSMINQIQCFSTNW